jgi:hypothetical protein
MILLWLLWVGLLLGGLTVCPSLWQSWRGAAQRGARWLTTGDRLLAGPGPVALA